MYPLSRHVVSDSFQTVSLSSDILPLGHVMSIDHFRMSEPTFPPHPHAGFSAVTWMLPWSPGAFINRDSLGDRSRIDAGALHWTRAASGMLHEEIPESPGVECEGLQMFVKLPESAELLPPTSFHLDPTAVPAVVVTGGRIRVLVGDVEGVASPVQDPSGTTLGHASVISELRLAVPEGVEAFAMVLRGRGCVSGQIAEPHMATDLRPGPVTFAGNGMEVLVGWSPAMPSQPIFRGPFCMFGTERLNDAARRFEAGRMGALDPSPSHDRAPTR